MKFRVDLLPPQFKCLPRDTFGMVVAMIAIILCVSASVSLYLKNTRDMADMQRKVVAAEKDVADLNTMATQEQPPLDRFNALKNSIDFINNNMQAPGSSFVDFLYTLESTVPERVSIRDISPKDFSQPNGTFTADGEAASIYDVLEFISRLQKSGRFTSIFPKQSTTRQVDGASITNFSIVFTYVGKK